MQEQIIDEDGFRLYARSLEVQFPLERVYFAENSARVKLKCVALVREMPTAIKESVVTIYVPSMDQLSNQKLINWRSEGKLLTKLSISLTTKYQTSYFLKTISHFQVSSGTTKCLDKH